MPAYSLSDLKKASGKIDIRQLELPLNKNKKIWIPSTDFIYHRIHFNVKAFFPRSKYETIDCSNQNLGQHGKGCPICALREKFWDDWKATKDKDEKKKIQDKINRIVAEEIWLNCIDIEDPDKYFQAVRFTMAKGKEMLATVENYNGDIGGFIWFYKKSKKDDSKTAKIEYTIQDIDSPELNKIAAELKTMLHTFTDRDYEHGGPVDIEGAIIRSRSSEQIRSIIEGGDSEDEDVEANVSSKKTQTEKIEINEEDTINLSDLDDKGSTSKDTSESLDMGDLDLDEPETPPVKMLKINAQTISDKAKAKEVDYLKALVSFALLQKWIKDTGKLTDNIKLVHKYVTDQKEVSVPETAFSEIPF